MKLALYSQVGYTYFGSALDAAIGCFREHGSAYINRPRGSASCYIYYASPVGLMEMLDATGRMEIENYHGDQATIAAVIILSGEFKL